MNTKMIILRNLVYLYFLRHPNMTGRRIFVIWERSNLLKEYPRPEEKQLVKWVDRFMQEVKEYAGG